jgi:hypothetical protein
MEDFGGLWYDCEDLITPTSHEQCDCERECAKFLMPMHTYSTDVITKLQEGDLVNYSKEIRLLRSMHAIYLTSGLQVCVYVCMCVCVCVCVYVCIYVCMYVSMYLCPNPNPNPTHHLPNLRIAATVLGLRIPRRLPPLDHVLDHTRALPTRPIA